MLPPAMGDDPRGGRGRGSADDSHLVKGGHGIRRKPIIHSRVVQVHCKDIVKNAVSILSSKSPEGEIPLVLIPEARNTLSMWMQVPTGVMCLMQRFGKDVGAAKPGLHLLPSWYRIAYVVSAQSCCYDAPVLCCPTKDNVRVAVDCTLVFQITDASLFIYRLGAKNFDDFLSGTVDEAIRMMVRQEDHTTVYSLRGDERADIMLNMLNDKFVVGGVTFRDVKVTSVWLPDKLANALEITTKIFKSMEKANTANDFELLKISQDSEMQCEEIRRRQEQTLVAEAGKKRRAELEKEQRNVKAEEEGTIAMMLAQGKVDVDRLTVENGLSLAKKRLETWRIKEMAEAETQADSKKIAADLSNEQTVITASWQMEKMVCDAEVTKCEADMEKEATKNLAAKREYDVMLREKGILKQLASKGSFNLIGTSGDRLIGAMLQGSFSDPSAAQGAS